ncbi:MAG: chemotaxis protein [Clostridiales bacterium]|nr:chemotaxis protein [Clostridiales bacterium]
MENGILLESGTNELEILEFMVGGNSYGINVAKIREILQYQRPTLVPNSHPCVEGIFMPRDTIITIIDLAKSLQLPQKSSFDKDMYIVTNFNNLQVGFHVNTVVGIHRVSWADISKPDATITQAGNSVATGIIKIKEKLIIILDFEKIVADISPETSLKISEIEEMGERSRNELPILVAEDSPLLSQLLHDCLYKAGYTNIMMKPNGQELWDLLNEYKRQNLVKEKVACVITDIEMPQMDGHRLTKLIKEDSVLKEIPVIIFSSLVNDDMIRKGESVGADAQLSKPEIGSLVNKMDLMLLK